MRRCGYEAAEMYALIDTSNQMFGQRLRHGSEIHREATGQFTVEEGAAPRQSAQ